MPATLILDILVAVLLVITIVYAVLLNRRLAALRRDRAEMEVLIKALNDATERAEAGVQQLRQSSEEVGGVMRDGLDKAQALRDDLAFLIDRGAVVADRLEGGIRATRDEVAGGSTVPRPAVQPPGGKQESDSRSEAERELLRALQTVR